MRAIVDSVQMMAEEKKNFVATIKKRRMTLEHLIVPSLQKRFIEIITHHAMHVDVLYEKAKEELERVKSQYLNEIENIQLGIERVQEDLNGLKTALDEIASQDLHGDIDMKDVYSILFRLEVEMSESQRSIESSKNAIEHISLERRGA
jgi:flagellin-specific chaperone FliS